jgi:hypothetical protein
MARFDAARVSTAEWIGMGAGLLAFISSFLPWFQISYSGPFASVFPGLSENAWSMGFTAWFPVLLLVAGGGAILAGQLGTQLPTMRIGWPLMFLGVAVLALLLMVIRWLTFDGGTVGVPGDEISYGAGFGLYVGLVAAIAFGFAQFLILRSQGQSLSDAIRQVRGPGASPTPPPAG